MYEFTHERVPYGRTGGREIYIRCAHINEYGTSATGLSITPEALPELIAYLQTLTDPEIM